MTDFILRGWAFSPYVRAVRIALEEKRADYRLVEMTPAELSDPAFRALSPFGKVPVLEHRGRAFIETPAILRYVDAAAPGPSLQPEDPARRAETEGLMLSASAYFYPTGVMGVFFRDVYVRENGGAPDQAAIAAAAQAAEPWLDFLSHRFSGPWLGGARFSLADALVGAMVSNFAMSRTGAAALARRPALDRWHAEFQARPSARATAAPVPRFGL